MSTGRLLLIKEFECKNCGDTIEVWERFDDVPSFCKKCGGDMEKIISRSSFILKGSGWYAIDYGAKETRHNKQV